MPWMAAYAAMTVVGVACRPGAPQKDSFVQEL